MSRFPFALSRLGTLVAAVIVVVGCQAQEKISLETAKRITADMGGTSLQVPPRTIEDIALVLEKSKPDLERVAALVGEAERSMPAGLTDSQKASFFYDRALAARAIGRTDQQFQDIRRAIALADDVDGKKLLRFYQQLAYAERNVGNLPPAIAAMKERIRISNKLKVKGYLYHTYGYIAWLHALVGDLVEANEWLAKAEHLLRNSIVRYFSVYSTDWESSVAEAQGDVSLLVGRYDDAETAFETAIERRRTSLQELDRWENPPPRINFEDDINSMTRKLARVKVRKGQILEAEALVRSVLDRVLRLHGKLSVETGETLNELASVLMEQARFEDAERIARTSVDLQRRSGAPVQSPGVVTARIIIADALVRRSEWARAAAEFDAIDGVLTGDHRFLRPLVTRDLDRAIALLMSGQPERARTMAEQIHRHDQATVGTESFRAAISEGILAMALADLGRRADAMARFDSAVAKLSAFIVESDDSGSGSSSMAQWLRLVLGSYVEFLFEARRVETRTATIRSLNDKAFRAAELTRRQSVERALAASSARAAARDPALADLVRQEQDAQLQINALYGLLANAASSSAGQGKPSGIASLRRLIDDLKGSRAALHREIETRFPEYGVLINPQPPSLEQVRSVLRPNEAMIVFFVGPDRTYVWAVPTDGAAAVSSVGLGFEELTERVASIRSALQPETPRLDEIPPFDVTAGHTLYRALLEPVKAGWQDAKSLLVVAHGPLGYLPFSVLPIDDVQVADAAPLFSGYREVPWLARSHAVTVLPSVASLRTLRALPAAPAGRRAFVGFGDPYFSKEQEVAARAEKTVQVAMRGLRLRSRPKTEHVDSAQLAMLPRLPDTGDEVRGMAQALKADPASSVFLGIGASEPAVKGMDLSAVRVVAFATHGLVPGDLDGLTQPALALASPDVAKGADDGLLTMGEILGLRLNADWVVLSACNTGAGEGAGAEAVSGLGRAFFYAGTRALLVSNWPVETTSARELTTRLFAAQAEDAGLERVQALRHAMLGLIDGDGPMDADGKVQFSYAHPLFWAPFSLIGDGGGTKRTIN